MCGRPDWRSHGCLLHPSPFPPPLPLPNPPLFPFFQSFTSLVADPLDCRRLCLTGTRGCLAIVDLVDPIGADVVRVKQYTLAMQQGMSMVVCGGGEGGCSVADWGRHPAVEVIHACHAAR